jgi:solute carrier family 25 phosphate transporter 23/24/25/41
MKCRDEWGLSRSQMNMIAGGIAGSVAKTATAPLSRLTILYQVHAIKTGVEYNIDESLLNVVKSIYRQEGALSFWRGNLTAIVHRFPYSGVNFTVYDFAKNHLKLGLISQL